MKRGKPKKTGWFWFYYQIGDTKHRSWAPARVVFVDGISEYLQWGLENTEDNLKLLDDTTDDQWGMEIEGMI